ncbi:MAG: hypothetical protein M0P12_00755 [Paludibacteraceae bacterium]|nr:hypothetical protein [Paludibacteraceae bacterium]MCK9616100.1 hypothetical protein [Candidatus Omnitrophota bacterium]
MFGYESWVLLNGIFIPASAADTQVDRARIDSSGIYGGSITGANIPFGQVHYYDWPNVSASLTTEATPTLITTVKDMILQRQNPVSLILNSGQSGSQELQQAWWNEISISTGEDALVTVNINFTALERTRFDIDAFSAYWSNQTGGFANEFLPEYDPIPFWKTNISEFEYVKNWNLTISQEIIKFFGCMNYQANVPMNPCVLGCGILSGNLTFATHENDSNLITAMPLVFSGEDVNIRNTMTINIDGIGITCKGELNLVDNPFSGTENLNEVGYNFQIYGVS